jgi:hypothetical protein
VKTIKSAHVLVASSISLSTYNYLRRQAAEDALPHAWAVVEKVSLPEFFPTASGDPSKRLSFEGLIIRTRLVPRRVATMTNIKT